MAATRSSASEVDGRWVVVLAGGAGRRLEALTTDSRGSRVPKQYCALRGERSLLQMALARAERLVPADRVVAVVQRDHRSWWLHELADLPPENVLAQPRDLGTGIGLLLALLEIRRRDPRAQVAFLPADHYLAREDLFAAGVGSAFEQSCGRPGAVVLLGVAHPLPDVELGWIVPGGEPSRLQEGEARPVASFREKPSKVEARELVERGALANCFVGAGRLDAHLDLFAATCPEVVEGLGPLCGGAGRADAARLAAAYERLPRLDLSRDVLAPACERLVVLALPDVGWTDLGTPASVRRCLGRHRVPVLPARSGRRAPVDLSAPRPLCERPLPAPAPDLSRYAEML